MNNETDWKETDHPAPGSWRDEEARFLKETKEQLKSIEAADLSAREQSRLLELLGLINFKILSGNSLYLEVDGARYKVLYGVYWRSVFTGEEHYLLRCSEITEGMWIEGRGAPGEVDLAIRYTEDGWIVKDCSLKFIATRSVSFELV
ncbi:MAG: hypothetical protein M3362_17710 [Acidobacteriota bacterium]|nr:hypothetical protein [Acidobacteriota bacterium]